VTAGTERLQFAVRQTKAQPPRSGQNQQRNAGIRQNNKRPRGTRCESVIVLKQTSESPQRRAIASESLGDRRKERREAKRARFRATKSEMQRKAAVAGKFGEGKIASMQAPWLFVGCKDEIRGVQDFRAQACRLGNSA
jgi:hypothetical protein